MKLRDYLTESLEYFSYKKFSSGKIRISYRRPGYKSVSTSKFKEDEEFGALLMDPSKELPEYYRVQNAVLDDDFIGKGYGIKIYKHALKVAKKEGFKGIVSNIKHRNKLAERVWKKLNAKRLKNYDVVE